MSQIGDWVFLEGDLSLRRLADVVQERLDAGGGQWYAYYVLIQEGGAYRCVRLTRLSAELEEAAWSLETPLSDLDLLPCEAMPASQVDDAALYRTDRSFVVALQDGRPLALHATSWRGGPARISHVGWWRLVGRRMAERGHLPPWPTPWPKAVQYREVVPATAETPLHRLAEQLVHMPHGEEATLIVAAPKEGQWVEYPARELLERIREVFPDAGPESAVGTFVDREPSDMIPLERAETPWELVEVLLGRSASTRLLITQEGRPVGMLRQQQGLRQGYSRDMVPKGISAGWARFLRQVDQVQPGAQDQGRVVNAWFANQGRAYLPYTHALAANQVYHLGVNIGRPSDRAHVIGAQPPLDDRLVSHVVREGKRLTLRVDSEDFWVLDGPQEVTLPAEGTSEERFFRLATPVRTGVSRLRLGVYFENNLVQSYLVHARVAPLEGPMPECTADGWWSECEYTLSSDLADLRQLSLRRVCVWIGQGQGERWRAGIAESTGLDMGPALEVSPGLIEAALARYRALLLQACVREDQYLYGADHAPIDPQTFEHCARDLAELGQTLYQRVFGTENGQQVAEKMRAIERGQRTPLVVQIARLSLDATFPWAVLYDRPLRYAPGRNPVCQEFLENGECATGCRYGDDASRICPYGFWGFRYVIEQPLRPPSSYTSVATRLQAEGRPRLALVYGTGLGLTEDHRRQVEDIARSRADLAVQLSTDTVLEEMRGGPAVVYFYCHGQQSPFRQWLVVRDDDPLMVTHLGDDLRVAWTARGARAPLVVLNGCHTARFDPSSLSSFVHRFGALGAAGVIGTEIPIHEYLGQEFGGFLIRRLLDGEAVGDIVHAFRRRLLGKRNLLGLAYVAYCYAHLHLCSGAGCPICAA